MFHCATHVFDFFFLWPRLNLKLYPRSAHNLLHTPRISCTPAMATPHISAAKRSQRRCPCLLYSFHISLLTPRILPAPYFPVPFSLLTLHSEFTTRFPYLDAAMLLRRPRPRAPTSLLTPAVSVLNSLSTHPLLLTSPTSLTPRYRHPPACSWPPPPGWTSYPVFLLNQSDGKSLLTASYTLVHPDSRFSWRARCTTSVYNTKFKQTL
jgi:hypothetical protein